MELKLGEAIKRLRAEKGVTQEELADYVKVSFQAVSKWETNTTMPDISLLPKLAVFFGVSIDSLFSVNTDDELERIDFMLANENLTDQNFTYAKRTLDSILKENENDTGALKRYAQLFLYKNNRDNLTAGRMLEKAIALSPLDEELYGIYRQVRGGDNYTARSGNDWFIRFCEPYAHQYPANTRLRKYLLEAYTEMRYFDRANEFIKAIGEAGDIEMAAVFSGDVAFASGDKQRAAELWSSADEKNSVVQYEAGERFNRINDYDRAIECFERSIECGQFPRDISATYSLAFLFTKLGQSQKAIDMWQRILDVMASDWNTTEGTSVDWPNHEIQKLKAKLG